jgi:hypothetical protein
MSSNILSCKYSSCQVLPLMHAFRMLESGDEKANMCDDLPINQVHGCMGRAQSMWMEIFCTVDAVAVRS